MTAANKAEYLINKFYQPIPINLPEASRHTNKDLWEHGKQCALICCDEMIIVLDKLRKPRYINYWQKVKKIIENS